MKENHGEFHWLETLQSTFQNLKCLHTNLPEDVQAVVDNSMWFGWAEDMTYCSFTPECVGMVLVGKGNFKVLTVSLATLIEVNGAEDLTFRCTFDNMQYYSSSSARVVLG